MQEIDVKPGDRVLYLYPDTYWIKNEVKVVELTKDGRYVKVDFLRSYEETKWIERRWITSMIEEG